MTHVNWTMSGATWAFIALVMANTELTNAFWGRVSFAVYNNILKLVSHFSAIF